MREFIKENSNKDPAGLRLKYHGKDLGFDVEQAITQIECRRKFAKKLSETLSLCPEWIFPSVLSGEQSTSDRLASYHASLVPDAASVIDLTAGLGIDAIHFARHGARVTALDIDRAKTDALRLNAAAMGIENLDAVNADCREYLRDTAKRYDVAFIDPARRASDGKRVFALSDCEPDVTSLLPDIRRVAKMLIVKMSPMLDISTVISELPETSRIIALGTATECKELIAVLDFSSLSSADVVIEAVTLTADSEITVAFTREEEAAATCRIAATLERKYLYEPYPAVMKAAPFRLLSERYDVDKIAPNTHLYLSDKERPDFPGNCWKVVKVVPYESRYIKRLKREFPRILVTTRNFPVGADALRAKLGVADTGNLRLFACLTADSRPVMIISAP